MLASAQQRRAAHGPPALIEPTLFFALGFLCALFLALMIAPAVWARAAAVTRRRVEATVPLSLNEIRADKDRMRAEFAMSTRRLEMSVQAFRDKAAVQVVEISRNQEQLRRLADEHAEKAAAISALEAQAGELRSDLRLREEQIRQAGERLAEAERRLEERAFEMEKLGRMYDEASFSASSRQIELVARDAEIERFSGDVSALRVQRKDDERRLREMADECKGLQDALRAEKRRWADADKRLERLTTALSDREDKLERREKELARLREQAKGAARTEGDLATELAESEARRVKLEADVADLTLQLSTLLSGATGADIEKAVGRLTQQQQRMEESSRRLIAENERLRGELEAQDRIKAADWNEQRRENAILREQINDLAAEVLKLTETLDGPASPITAALASPPRAIPHAAGATRPVSLADRVRALRETASAG